jgi:hypothetical protein
MLVFTIEDPGEGLEDTSDHLGHDGEEKEGEDGMFPSEFVE